MAARISARWGERRTQEIDDLAQEIHLKLAEQSSRAKVILPENDDEAEAFLRAMAANAARDSMRSRFARKRGKYSTESLEERHSAFAREMDNEGIEREILFRQVDDLLQASSRERSIFWLYYRQGLSAREIAAIPAVGLSAKGVESLIFRLGSAARERLKGGHVSRRGSATNG